MKDEEGKAVSLQPSAVRFERDAGGGGRRANGNSPLRALWVAAQGGRISGLE